MKTKTKSNQEGGLESTYHRLLKSPQWIRKRSLILDRDNNKCQNCSDVNKLQVHHRQYQFDRITGTLKQPWKYHNKYLVTLCESCHRTGHKLYKVPVININNFLS